jgi:hypothetical protein
VVCTIDGGDRWHDLRVKRSRMKLSF